MGFGLPGKKKQEAKPELKAPVAPVEVQEAEEVPDFEEVEEDDVETNDAHEPKEDTPEAETELTEEVVKAALANLQYRLARLEHHLRLDY